MADIDSVFENYLIKFFKNQHFWTILPNYEKCGQFAHKHLGHFQYQEKLWTSIPRLHPFH